MAKKDNLPRNVVDTTDAANTISYAPEVIAIIAGVAANEVDGVAGMANMTGGLLNRGKNIAKGVKVEVGTEEVGCDLYLNIEYGRPIQRVCRDVQESVRKALEAMTGLHVVRVDVHVQGVSFEKENSAITAGAQKASLTAAPEEKPAAPAEEAPVVEEAPAAEEAPVVDAILDEKAEETLDAVAEEVTETAEEAAEDMKAAVEEDA